jgi:SynChlorMet cassette protein ScmD
MNINPLRNPDIVFREEFDDWGVLFDPETGNAVALDPVAVFYWKHLDGSSDMSTLIEMLKHECEDVPEGASEHLDKFIKQLEDAGFVSV